MNKQELVREIGRRTRLSNEVVRKVVDSLVDVLNEEIASGERIEIANFLVLELETHTRQLATRDSKSQKRSLQNVSITYRILKVRPSKHLRKLIQQAHEDSLT